MTAKFRITGDFSKTLKQYALVSKRSVPTILNTKGFFIARRAVIETPKADIAKMGKELGQLLSIRKNRRTGKMAYSSRGLGSINNAAGYSAPLLALIINARRGRSGLPGLHGIEMKREFRKIWALRAKSIAFLKSGWLPAIKKLQPLADKGGAPKQEAGVKQVGQAKGFAAPAAAAWIAKCVIENRALAKHDKKESLIQYGYPALQRAFDAERKSMKEYMERKLKESARKLGIRLGRF